MSMNAFRAENLKPLFEGKKILLGITGSIAAFKAIDIIRILKELGASVRVVPTENAFQFVTKITLETLSGEPVHSSLWSNQGTHHIDAARWADVALIAPATANTIAKLAHGLCDDLLTTELLAFTGPVLVAPAMNPAMYSHPATQSNVNVLKSRGVQFVGPVSGITSCREEGMGRMCEPADIVDALSLALRASPQNKRILITLGPTRSHLDPVRYLTNRSSGRMGAALCWEAFRRGYDVTAVCGPLAEPPELLLPPGTKIERVTTATEMLTRAGDAWPESSGFIATAAVLDWDADASPHKIKKSALAPTISLRENPDILQTLASQRKPEQWVLGFAAETQNAASEGVRKLRAKGCDFLFANDVSRDGLGFESSRNAGFWIESSNIEELGPCSKAELAGLMFDRIERPKDAPSNSILI